ncbi:ribokinase [Shewanella sp. OMA3-2]|uniref:ribokinase n=1 Tax=Shewanella sp. OMA3-2 TaxID=2908650 RepID=UPI001F4699B3|nr:ribokinase [Shewanella sp. OMA3-2]UJF21902.1 ribokinase [Shewanella sp. OMA3-2]
MHKQLSNQQLSKLLTVTAKTIRCDLVQLEQAGLVKRIHGGVSQSEGVDISKFSLDAMLTELIQHSAMSDTLESDLKQGRLRKMKHKVFVLGSFNVDIVANLERFPQPGETLHSSSSSIGAGGKGANQAYAAAKNGANVTFMTKIGTDQFSQFARQHLSSTGIDNTIIVESSTSPTGTALIYVSEQLGENMIAVNEGANMTLTDDEVHSAEQHIIKAELFLTQLETNFDAIKLAMTIAKDNGAKVILNPAPYHDRTPELLHLVDMITPNETEASLMTGIKVTDLNSAKQAAIAINKLGVTSVVITRGSDGVLLYENDQFIQIDVLKSVVVDTTGAGDAFNGALVAELAKGSTLHEAALYANAYASLAVERLGAANMPDASLVAARLKIA